MTKPSVIRMLGWALPHSKNAPAGVYSVDFEKVASEDPWKYVLGTIYDMGTPELLERKRKKHYADWNEADFKRRAKGANQPTENFTASIRMTPSVEGVIT